MVENEIFYINSQTIIQLIANIIVLIWLGGITFALVKLFMLVKKQKKPTNKD